MIREKVSWHLHRARYHYRSLELLCHVEQCANTNNKLRNKYKREELIIVITLSPLGSTVQIIVTTRPYIDRTHSDDTVSEIKNMVNR